MRALTRGPLPPSPAAVADGNAANGFEFSVATLVTTDVVTVGQDVLLGS